jgi:hypothetical protein
VDILFHSGLEVDPYFSILMPDPPVGWRRAWFLLKNDADMPLPMFKGGCPIPHPNWEYSVARADIQRMQPLLDIIRGLLQRGFDGCRNSADFFQQRGSTASSMRGDRADVLGTKLSHP